MGLLMRPVDDSKPGKTQGFTLPGKHSITINNIKTFYNNPAKQYCPFFDTKERFI